MVRGKKNTPQKIFVQKGEGRTKNRCFEKNFSPRGRGQKFSLKKTGFTRGKNFFFLFLKNSFLFLPQNFLGGRVIFLGTLFFGDFLKKNGATKTPP
ncbi:hypothetical protein EBI_25680 [Enterocytozoon bieneusi H348]|nr:hypothetical protein EBI_25680 [Enterocytozoon bieneusi H348]|eukprot:XP_002651094.1 hypothetical protein EBI_25680 [Enterocytozoon bieneusi H348]